MIFLVGVHKYRFNIYWSLNLPFFLIASECFHPDATTLEEMRVYSPPETHMNFERHGLDLA